MKNKLLRNSACISTILFLGFLILYIYAEIADPHTKFETSPIVCPHISFGNVNVTVTRNWGGNLIFFDQAVPYMGGTIAFTGDKSVKETGCDFYGIYFRTIKHAVKKDWDQWTLMISLWYPIILFGILPAIFAVKKLRGRKSVSTEKTVIEK
jgi:hypothetical protein